MRILKWISEASIQAFAAVVGVFLFVALSVAGLVAVFWFPEAVEAWKEIFVIVMPTVSAILLAYGITKSEE